MTMFFSSGLYNFRIGRDNRILLFETMICVSRRVTRGDYGKYGNRGNSIFNVNFVTTVTMVTVGGNALALRREMRYVRSPNGKRNVCERCGRPELAFTR